MGGEGWGGGGLKDQRSFLKEILHEGFCIVRDIATDTHQRNISTLTSLIWNRFPTDFAFEMTF